MVNSYGLPECVDWVERESGWQRAQGQAAARARVAGLGFACSHYISGASKPVNWTGEPHATVKIKLDFDGSVVVLSGAAEIGQGSSTILVQTVAEVLGLDLARVRVVTGDSEVVPKDNGSYSSRVTFMVGNAAIDAAQNLKRVLVAAAARKLDAKPDEIECLGELYRAGAQDKGADLRRGRDRGAQGHRHHHGDRQLFDHPGIARRQEVSRLGDRRHHGLQLLGAGGRGQVDEETGVVTVDKVWVAHDCGKALNRLTVEGQVQGSVWMGMGQAMSEETAYHEGLMLTANMLDYRVPTIQDFAADRGRHRREQRSAWAVRRQGGGRRLARGVPAGAHQRHRRRHRAALQRPAGDARPRVRRDREAPPRRRRRTAAEARLMDALPEFELLRPTTLDDVIAARAAHPDSRLLGGGTDLVVNIRRGIVAPPVLIDVNAVAELRTIKADAQYARDRRLGDARRARRASRT